jgi:hypothetical protein
MNVGHTPLKFVACKPRHRHQEFLAFLRQVAKAYPRVPLHVVCDNYATHKHWGVSLPPDSDLKWDI